MKDMKKMLAESKKGKKDNKSKDAKMNVLKDMHKMASDMMNGDGMKKVTVAAKDNKGLMSGLEKAEELLKKKKG